jgi:hypothetical protein
MKKLQKEVIKDLYREASCAKKELIKKAFPEVLGLPETGWLMHEDENPVYRTGTDTGYGFDGKGRWIEYANYISFTFIEHPQYWQPAPEKEVKKMLIKEAKRRGVWDCPINTHADGSQPHKNVTFYKSFEYSSNRLWSQYGLVFDNGKWATPIEKEHPKISELIREEKTETIHLFGNTYKISLVN